MIFFKKWVIGLKWVLWRREKMSEGLIKNLSWMKLLMFLSIQGKLPDRLQIKAMKMQREI